METTKLYALAENRGITVDRCALPRNKSISVNLNDQLFVALDLALTGIDEKVCLAHELGHCESGSFYNIYSPFDIREKHERRANIWAIKKLIPRYRFEKAIRNGYDNIYDLAEYFSVSCDFMQKAVEYYNN